jgi:ABC-type nickel/cobalt efflux system permease component RcnA
MRRALILALAGAAALLLWLWASGGFDSIAVWAANEQRAFQNSIARTLRALRGGEAGAYALLMGSCFAYGFFHAIGPGHGKLLVGGYGLARKVPVLRLSLIALASSLGQAITAILLAYGGLWLLGLTRERMVGAAEDWLAPISYAMVAAIGLWLALRGARRLRQVQAVHVHSDHHGHNHNHDHKCAGEACGSCGHRHGPSIEEAEQTHSLRDALLLVAGIAIRPCTGALFVLIITWQMDIAMAGIAGAFAMALGTASVTVAVGIVAAGFRGGIWRAVAQAGALVWVMPVIEIAAGLFVVALSGALLLRAL